MKVRVEVAFQYAAIGADMPQSESHVTLQGLAVHDLCGHSLV